MQSSDTWATYVKKKNTYLYIAVLQVVFYDDADDNLCKSNKNVTKLHNVQLHNKTQWGDKADLKVISPVLLKISSIRYDNINF